MENVVSIFVSKEKKSIFHILQSLQQRLQCVLDRYLVTWAIVSFVFCISLLQVLYAVNKILGEMPESLIQALIDN